MIALPPSLYSITSVERLIALTLLTPATGVVRRVEVDEEAVGLVRVEAGDVDGERLGHVGLVLLATAVWPASCAILMITNSAGFSGAKATTMLTIPFAWSSGVVVVASQLTWNAWLGVVPWNAPWLNRPSMKLSIVVLIDTHSGTSFGSKITQPRLCSSDCSRNSAIRRTGT